MFNPDAVAVCSLLIEKERGVLCGNSHAIPNKCLEDRQEDHLEESPQMHILGFDSIRILNQTNPRQENHFGTTDTDLAVVRR